MTCRGGPCARPHPEWRKRRSAMSIHPCCISVSFRVADGHRARPCTSSVVYFNTFTAFPPLFSITTWPGLASLMRWPWRL